MNVKEYFKIVVIILVSALVIVPLYTLGFYYEQKLLKSFLSKQTVPCELPVVK